MRPEMSIVGPAFTFAGAGEGLTGTATRPNRSVIGPAGESERVGPAADAGEPMALDEPLDITGLNVLDVALIDFAIGNQPRFDQLAQPGRRVLVVFVVIRRHVSRHERGDRVRGE